MLQEWELVNPEGEVVRNQMKFADRTATLEEKTVVLRWNGKPNGEYFLNKIAELLIENVKGIKIVKAYEVAPETSVISHGREKSAQIAKKLMSYEPDMVIASQAD